MASEGQGQRLSRVRSWRALFLPLETMVNFDDYDEFGNYIGGDIDSDDDNDDVPMQRAESAFVPQQQPAAGPSHAPLEGYDDDDGGAGGQDEDSAMQVDGTCGLVSRSTRYVLISFQTFHATR